MLPQPHRQFIQMHSHRHVPNCSDMCFHQKYRSQDGTWNSLPHPTWGTALTTFEHILKPAYENRFNIPRGVGLHALPSGYLLLLTRLISTELAATTTITPDDR